MAQEWTESSRLLVPWEQVVHRYLSNVRVADHYRQNELLVDKQQADQKERFIQFRSNINASLIPEWLRAVMAGVGFACQIKTTTSVVINESTGQMMAITRNETGSNRVAIVDRTCFAKDTGAVGKPVTHVKHSLTIDCRGVPKALQPKCEDFIRQSIVQYRQEALEKLARSS